MQQPAPATRSCVIAAYGSVSPRPYRMSVGDVPTEDQRRAPLSNAPTSPNAANATCLAASQPRAPGRSSKEATRRPTFSARHRIYACSVLNLGAKIAFTAVREGTPVYDARRARVGVVDEVIADDTAGIFKGIVIHTAPLPGRHLVADVDQITAMHERGVVLSVERAVLRAELRGAAATSPNAEPALEPPVHAALRRIWDRITRRR